MTKAINLYLVTLTPTLSAAIRLSRRAMMARPARLRTRLSTMTRVIIMSTNPAVKVDIAVVPVAPWAPLMIAIPPGSRPRSLMVRLPLMLKAICSPRLS